MHMNLKVNKKVLVPLFILLVSVSFLLPFQSPSSAQANFCPGNVVSNGTFTGSAAPWTPAYGTPDWGNPGQVGMWGNMNPAIGEGLKQTLSLTPGTNYNGTISYRIVPGPDKQANGRIRIRLSTAALTQVGTANTIYLSPMTPASANTWTTVNFSFVAPAGPHILTINVENTLIANNGAMTSYGVIDNVCIQPQAPEITGPKEVCQNQLAAFTGSAASSWNWTFGDGGASTQQNPSHAYATPGTYNVKLCVNGTTSCVTKTIVVNPAPAPPVITGPAESCTKTVTYSVAATPGLSYSWTATNGTINGSSTGSSVNVTWNSSGVGVIAVTVTNKAGCSTTVRKEVLPCDLHQGECCHGFQGYAKLKSFTYAGNGNYNLVTTLTGMPAGVTRVVANIESSSVTYSPATCGKPGPVNGYVVGAGVAGPLTPSIPITNGHEGIWFGSPSSVNGVDFPMTINFPAPPVGHCTDFLTVCIKYTITDSHCRSCEVIVCYGPFKRGGLIKDATEFTEIKNVN
jgi:hypothetical protein